jgi:hypothetical protein
MVVAFLLKFQPAKIAEGHGAATGLKHEGHGYYADCHIGRFPFLP